MPAGKSQLDRLRARRDLHLGSAAERPALFEQPLLAAEAEGRDAARRAGPLTGGVGGDRSDRPVPISQDGSLRAYVRRSTGACRSAEAFARTGPGLVGPRGGQYSDR